MTLACSSSLERFWGVAFLMTTIAMATPFSLTCVVAGNVIEIECFAK